MFRSLFPVGFVVLSAATQALAQNCSLASRCPESAPCCSQYGECGVGAYCLGGCDPRMSFSLDSCVPEPVCQSKIYPMNSMSGIVSENNYLGDSSTADWVYTGTPLLLNDQYMLLTMPKNSGGTVLASSTYMWYGNVKATLKTSRGAGVVTAFILLSDVKDEIDFEFVGNALTTAETNFYFQGIPDYNNAANISGLSDTYDNFHTYEIQWTPDEIRWYVDGQLGRTQKKSDTWNATANQWNFPQTPARVEISIWPGGASSNAQGTIDWAGGAIDWNSQDIQDYGYDFATFGQIEVSCYNATSPPGTNTGKSYTYDSYSALNNTVVDGNNSTVLASFLGTGLDMNAGNTSSSASSSSGTATATAPVNTIPGGSSSGPGSNPGSNSGSGSGSGSGTSTGSSAACTATGFTQDCGSSSSTGTKSDGFRGAERTLGASAFAVVMAFAGVFML